MASTNTKIWFLQLVRVVACLSVIYTHWYGLLTIPNQLAKLILQNPLPNYPMVNLPDYVGIMAGHLGLNYLATAYYGVGLFFILSGYVIPLSLNNTTPKNYLIRRLFRIYPALIVSSIFLVALLLIANHFIGAPAHRSLLNFKTLFGNLSLTRDFFKTAFIDNVTWSLEIELHFYLLFFLYFYKGIEKKINTFLLTILSLFILSRLLIPVSKNYSNLVDLNICYLSFMFVGTALYYTLAKQWRLISGISCAASLLIINYLLLVNNLANGAAGESIFINHCYALFTFLFLLLLNPWLKYSRLLNSIAEISYPLYLLHGFTGYTLYFICFHLTENIIASALLSFAIVIILAIIVHRRIEQPGIEYSKSLLRRFEEVPYLSSDENGQLLGKR